MKKFTKSPLTFFLAFAVFFNYSGFSYAANLPVLTGVEAGSVSTTTTSATTMDISVGQNRSIGRYSEFNVGTGYGVNINHAGSGWTSLHRVDAGHASSILGNMNSNGQVFLVNPSGILFGANSRIDMPGLVASTLDISNTDFGNANYAFARNGATGNIENRGIINGGYIGLLAPQIRNSGSIVADTGTVVLASGDAMTLSLDDASDISAVVNNVTGFDGSALVANSGSISAQGGRVVLTAKTLNSVLDTLVNNTGVVNADTLSSQNGEIYIQSSGSAAIAGTVSALDGQVDVEADGNVSVANVVADAVDVSAGGTINESGSDGTADITADTVTLEAGTGIGGSQRPEIDAATLSASSTTGAIRLRNLNDGSSVSATAGNGSIDIISDVGLTISSLVSLMDADTNDISVTASTGNINVEAINAGAQGDIVLTATAGTITDNGTAVAVTGDELTLSAASGIGGGSNGDFNTDVNTLTAKTTGAGNISLADAGSVTLKDVETADGTITISAMGDMQVTKVVSSTDAEVNDIALTAGGDMTVKAINAGVNGDVTLSAVGSVLDSGTSDKITADGLTINAGTGIGSDVRALDTNVASLDASVTDVGSLYIKETNGINLADIDTKDGSISVTAAGNILASDVQTLTDSDANDIVIETTNGGNITIGQILIGTNFHPAPEVPEGFHADSGDVTLKAAGQIIQGAKGVMADALVLQASTGIGAAGALNTAANSLDATVTGTGAIQIGEFDGLTVTNATTNSGSITINANGAMDAQNVVAGGTGKDVTLDAKGDLTVGTVTAAGDTADLTSQEGSILDDGNDATVVKAQDVYLTAAVGIGNDLNGTVDTDANGLDLTSGIGGVNVYDIGSVQLNGLNVASDSLVHLATNDALTLGTDISLDGTTTLDLDVNTDNAGAEGFNQNGYLILTDNSNVDIEVQGTGSALISQINAGSGDVSITSVNGDILTDSSTITARGLELYAGNGLGDSVGTLGGPINTDVDTISATAGTGGIFISEANDVALVSLVANNGPIQVDSLGGSLTVTTVSAGTGDVTLNAFGDILDNGSLISGDALTLNAGGAIGALGAAINTAVNSLNLTSTSGINVVEADGANINNLSSNGGDTWIHNLSGLLRTTAAIDTNGGELLLSSNGDLTLGNSNTDDINTGARDAIFVADADNDGLGTLTFYSGVGVTSTSGVSILGHNIVLNAGSSVNYGSGNLMVAGTGNATMDVGFSGTGDIILNSAFTSKLIGTGDIEIGINEMIPVGLLQTGNIILSGVDLSGRDVRVNSAGSVTGLIGLDIAADDLTINAVNGINLDTNVDTLDASLSAAGDIRINETDTITLTDVETFDGSVVVTAGSTINAVRVVANDPPAIPANVVLTALTGDINVTEITADGYVRLTANTGAITDVNDDSTNVTADTIFLDAATGIDLDAATTYVLAETTNGNIDVDNVSDATVEVDLTTGVGSISFDQTGAGALKVWTAKTGTGDVSLSANQDMYIDEVTAGGVGSAATLVSTDGALVRDGDSGITATNAILSALDGIFHGYGMNTHIQNLQASNVNNNIEINNAGDLTLKNFTSGSAVANTHGNTAITATGSMTVENAVRGGGSIDLWALGSAPSSDGTLTVNADVQSTGGSDVYLSSEGDLTQNSGSIETAGKAWIYSDAGNFTQNGGDITAANLELWAAGDITAQQDNQVDSLDVAYSFSAGDVLFKNVGDLTIGFALTADGSIGIETSGTITANNVVSYTNSDSNDIVLTATGVTSDILLGLVDAGTAGGVTLTAGDQIIDNNVFGADITAGDLTMSAVNGIGSGDALDTAVSNLDAVNTNNNIEVSNTGALTLKDLNSDGKSVSNGGSVTISAGSPLTVNSAVMAGGDIALTAVNDGADDDDLTVNADIQSSLGGTITLDAGHDFVQNSGLIETTGNVDITAARDIVQAGGSVSADALTLTATTGAIYGVLTPVTNFLNNAHNFFSTSVNQLSASGTTIDVYNDKSVEVVDVEAGTEASIVADGTITVDFVSAPLVTLEAQDGSIIGANDEDVDVSADSLYLYAAGDIYGEYAPDTYYGNEGEAGFLVTDAENVWALADERINLYATETVTLEDVQTQGVDPESVTVVSEGDINVGYVFDAYDVTLEADGSITGLGDNEFDIETQELFLKAGEDIDLGQEAVAAITADADGSISFTNTNSDGLTIGIDGMGLTAGTTIDVTETDGDISVIEDVTTNGDIALTSELGNIIIGDDDDTLENTDITSQAGKIDLTAAGNVEQMEGTIKAAGDVTITADSDETDGGDFIQHAGYVETTGEGADINISAYDAFLRGLQAEHDVTVDAAHNVYFWTPYGYMGGGGSGEYNYTLIGHEWLSDSLPWEYFFYADDSSAGHSLPFAFPFFGSNYTNVGVSTNGWLTMNGTYWGYPMIVPASTDWVTALYYVQPTPDTVAFRWTGYRWSWGGSVNLQVVLNSNGAIQFNYGSQYFPDGPTSGLYNPSGTFIPGPYNGAGYSTFNNAPSVLWNGQPAVIVANNNVTIHAGNEIIDENGTTRDVQSASLTMTAGAGIGNEDAIDTDVATITASVSGAGNININERNAVDLLSVHTADGAIDIEAAGDITATDVYSETDDDVNDITLNATTGDIIIHRIDAGEDNGDVSLTAQDDIIGQNDNGEEGIDITADTLTLDAGDAIYGNYGTETYYGHETNNFLKTNVNTVVADASNSIDIYNTRSADVHLTASGDNSITFVADGDIDVSYVYDPNHVTLEAHNGSITGNNNHSRDIVSDNVYLYATNSIVGNMAQDSYFYGEVDNLLNVGADYIEAVAGNTINLYVGQSVTLGNVVAQGETSVLVMADGDIQVGYVSDAQHVTLEAYDGSIIGLNQNEVDISTNELYLYTEWDSIRGNYGVEDLDEGTHGFLLTNADTIDAHAREHIHLYDTGDVEVVHAMTQNGPVDIGSDGSLVARLVTAGGTGSVNLQAAGDVTADSVTADGTGDVFLASWEGNIIAGSVTAVGNLVLLDAAGDVLDDHNDGTLITAADVDITAGGKVGDTLVSGALDVDADTITVNAGDDIILEETDGATFVLNSTNGSSDVLAHGTSTLQDSTVDGTFTFRTTAGDILLDGTVTSVNGDAVTGGINMMSDFGSINSIRSGIKHLVAGGNGNSYLRTPNGTMGLVDGALDVDINGALILDIGTRGPGTLNSGKFTGTVRNPGVDIPTFDPVSFPSPLYPPGNVYFNGIRIWPSPTSFLLSQATSGLVSKFQFPTSERLMITQINVMDLTASRLVTPVYFYHPLSEVDSGSYDGFELDEGAYEFIDGQIDDCTDKDGKPCKKHQS